MGQTTKTRQLTALLNRTYTLHALFKGNPQLQYEKKKTLLLCHTIPTHLLIIPVQTVKRFNIHSFK